MKNTILILTFALSASAGMAQNKYLDSLKNALRNAKTDTGKIYATSFITGFYTYSRPDSAMLYAQQEISLARKMQSDKSMAAALRGYAGVLSVTGNYPQAIYFELESLKLSEKTSDSVGVGWSYSWLVSTYTDAADYENALFYARQQQSLVTSFYQSSAAAMKNEWYADLQKDVLVGFATVYDKLNMPDSALTYLKMVDFTERDDPRLEIFGNLYFEKGEYAKALNYYRSGYHRASTFHVYSEAILSCNGLAKTFRKVNLPDSGLFYAKKTLELNNYAKYPLSQLEALDLLTDIYRSTGNSDSIVKYLQLSLSVKDSLFNQRKIMQMQSMTFNERLRQQDIADAQQAYRDKIKNYLFIFALIGVSIVAFVLFRSNSQKKKANAKIERAYTELKSAQAQLIQSEKMASLGALTAGIAHEIQNPLNFVNNFSEVNSELISEMRAEIAKKNYEEVDQLAKDIQENEAKINHHGKRADAIVKGMLQHSRSSTGISEPTDINALADEYLRLSYHGLRSKEKQFNVTLKTDLDDSIGKIKIIPQDIGRVLLNLYNNAFFAVNEKAKTAGESYQPIVSVQTKKLGNNVVITIADNGNGIPSQIVDQIFQPFFTTKPTGQGTGLGLSLSYDIVKAHGGEITVETKENDGTAFSVKLPIGR